MKQPNFKPSVDQQMLCKELLKLEVGESLSYETLSNAIKGDVRRKHRHILTSARKALLREHQRVFAITPGIGVYRMKDFEIVASAAASVSTVNRGVKRNLKKLSCADFAKLDPVHQIKQYVAASMLGALADVTSTMKLRRIQAIILETPRRLEVNETLALFG